MKIINVEQGTPEWHQHRRAHFNASDAGAMMGRSPYESRSQLIHRLATGIEKEVTSGMRHIFSKGHEYEAIARPWAEAIIGEKLSADVGTLEIDGLMLSASFDGLAEDCNMIWEHKTWSKANYASVDQRLVPFHIRPQIEQQLLISGADLCLFMISNGDGFHGMMSCTYISDKQLRADLIDGWQQLKKDIAAYKPTDIVVKATGKAPQSLPALHIEVSGMVTSSNLAEFKENAFAVIGRINRDLTTDEDFVDAAKSVKWCAEVEARLVKAKQHALKQTASIDELFKTIDEISAEARQVRLGLDKLVTTRKASIKQGMVSAAQEVLSEHISSCMSLASMPIMPYIASDFAGVTKGMSSLANMLDAVDTELARCKIEADKKCSCIIANLAWFDLTVKPKAMSFLFEDLDILVNKPHDEFTLKVSKRIAIYERVAAEIKPVAVAILNKPVEIKSAPVMDLESECDAINHLLFGMDIKQLKRVSAFCSMVRGKVAA